ncbi:MAG: class I SAM-dependent methyltransferase, partial [Patescibacteria group bacterium]
MLQTSNYIKHTTKNPLKKWLINYFYKVLFGLIANLEIKTILDAGCGEGFSLNQLKKKFPSKIYTGIDASSKAIKLGKKIFPNIKLKTGNIYRLPDKDRIFDLVICTEVLEHLAKPAKALQE